MPISSKQVLFDFHLFITQLFAYFLFPFVQTNK